MAVPKKRTGKSAQGHRRSNWKGTVPTTTKCSNCGATVLTHTVCTACGYYKGKPASLKDDNSLIADDVKPTENTVEPEEVKVVEEVKTEETTEAENTEDKAE